MQRPLVLFLVNGSQGSAMAIRAESLAQRLRPDFRIEIEYRTAEKVASTAHFFAELLRKRPSICYVFDMAFSGVLAAALYRTLSCCRMIVDTGDAIYELSRNGGERGTVGLALTKALEWVALSRSDRVVVRSHPHQELLNAKSIQSTVIPDGVDMAQFRPSDKTELRARLGLADCTTIGVLGSLIWNRRWQMCYGCELIEVIQALRHLPVKGVIIGDGSGMGELKARCSAAGLDNRILFLGRVPYEDLPGYLNLIDICISTQTNDTAGQVRTTGKLPLYLASGRFVLATRVGEAARVLPPEMLVEYTGAYDPEYPGRLAAHIEALLRRGNLLEYRDKALGIACMHFDYDVLAARLREVLEGACGDLAAE